LQGTVADHCTITCKTCKAGNSGHTYTTTGLTGSKRYAHGSGWLTGPHFLDDGKFMLPISFSGSVRKSQVPRTSWHRAVSASPHTATVLLWLRCTNALVAGCEGQLHRLNQVHFIGIFSRRGDCSTQGRRHGSWQHCHGCGPTTTDDRTERRLLRLLQASCESEQWAGSRTNFYRLHYHGSVMANFTYAVLSSSRFL
jgi:hypothetical protein